MIKTAAPALTCKNPRHKPRTFVFRQDVYATAEYPVKSVLPGLISDIIDIQCTEYRCAVVGIIPDQPSVIYNWLAVGYRTVKTVDAGNRFTGAVEQNALL